MLVLTSGGTKMFLSLDLDRFGDWKMNSSEEKCLLEIYIYRNLQFFVNIDIHHENYVNYSTKTKNLSILSSCPNNKYEQNGSTCIHDRLW